MKLKKICSILKINTNDSNFDLESFVFKCLGPEESAVIKGKFTSV